MSEQNLLDSKDRVRQLLVEKNKLTMKSEAQGTELKKLQNELRTAKGKHARLENEFTQA